MIGASQVLDIGMGMTGDEWVNGVKDEVAVEYLLLLYELCVYEAMQGDDMDLSKIYSALFLYNSPPH